MIIVRGHIGEKPVTQDWAKDKIVSTYNYRCHALVVVNRSSGTVYVQVFDQPGSDTTKSLDGSGIPRYDVPVPTGDTFTLQDSQFFTGLYVRAVTAAGGSSLIATNDVKITAEGLHWPVSNA